MTVREVLVLRLFMRYRSSEHLAKGGIGIEMSMRYWRSECL